MEDQVTRLRREAEREKARADAAEARAEKALAQRLAFDEALAAARRECEGLRGAVALHLKCPEEAAVSCLAEIRDDFSVVDSALAAPGDGEEGTR